MQRYEFFRKAVPYFPTKNSNLYFFLDAITGLFYSQFYFYSFVRFYLIYYYPISLFWSRLNQIFKFLYYVYFLM